MHFALVHYLDVGSDAINELRRKYDPTAHVIEPHITVVFPVPESVAEKPMLEHIGRVLQGWKSFPIRLSGLSKSPDHCLFLDVEKGRSELVHLFEEMYTGPLARYRRQDIEYTPHVGLGIFVKEDVRYHMAPTLPEEQFDESRYQQAFEEAEALPLNIASEVSTLDFVAIPDPILDWATGRRGDVPTDERVVTRQKFSLGSNV